MAVFFDVYHKMYEKPLLFKVNCFLLRTGVEKQLAYLFKTLKKELGSKVNEESKDFFDRNSVLIDTNSQILADEKSREIYKAVIGYRIHRKPLRKNVYSLNDQYFPKDVLSIGDREIFIDCGAFVGDTINNLFVTAKRINKKIEKIVAFEPEHRNCILLKKYYSNDERVISIEAGVSDKDKNMRLVGESTYAKLVPESEGKGKAIKLTSIDDTKECYDATYIKMDIEGAEMDALKGAAETIKRNKPKLAICIYHSNKDMVRIIPFVHELNPDYKLYVRHHSRDTSETVLYAVP